MYQLDLDWANTYFVNRLRNSIWTSANLEERLSALTMACNIIIPSFTWSAEAFFNVEKIADDGTTETLEDCATQIKVAIAEQALWLLKVDPTEYPEILTLGIQSGSAGSVSGTFSKEFIAPLVCPLAKQIIGELGEFEDYSDSVGRGRSFPMIY